MSIKNYFGCDLRLIVVYFDARGIHRAPIMLEWLDTHY